MFRPAWVLPAWLGLASCVPLAGVDRAADELGLEGAERRRFQREVEACVRRRDRETTGGPTIAVSAQGGADADSGAGLAAIGVAAAVLAGGIVYGVAQEDAASEEDPDAASEEDVEAAPEVDVLREEPPDVSEPFVAVCVHEVSARWRASAP